MYHFKLTVTDASGNESVATADVDRAMDMDALSRGLLSAVLAEAAPDGLTFGGGKPEKPKAATDGKLDGDPA